MAYKPKMKQGGSFGPQGVAKVEVHPTDKSRIRFTMKERKWNQETQVEEFKEHKGEVDRSDCPDRIQPLIRAGVWYISANSDLNKIYTIRPVSGVYEVTVDHFSAAEGQPPAPKMSTGKWPYPYFTVILRITSGTEKGMEIPYTLHYHFDKEFEPIDDQGTVREVVAYSHPKSKHTLPLADFCDAAGAWEKGPMPYKDNILPMLQKRILDANKAIRVVLKNGQVAGIVGKSSLEDDFAPNVEE